MERIYIMNAKGIKLTEIISGFLSEFDNYMQIAADNNDKNLVKYISKDYHKMEIFYFKSKKEELTSDERNNIRLDFKHNSKLMGKYLN